MACRRSHCAKKHDVAFPYDIAAETENPDVAERRGGPFQVEEAVQQSRHRVADRDTFVIHGAQDPVESNPAGFGDHKRSAIEQGRENIPDSRNGSG